MIVAGDLRSAVTAIQTPVGPTTAFTVGVGPGGHPLPGAGQETTTTQTAPSAPAGPSTPVSPVLQGILGVDTHAVTTSASLTPDDPNAPTGPIDEAVLGNINLFSAAFQRVGKMEWVLDPGEAERLKANGSPPELIGTPGFGFGHWVYHGHGTIARQQAMFVAAKSDPSYRKPLASVHEASVVRGNGWSPTEGRIYERLLALVASAADPGDAPIGNDGVPIGYGSDTGYGNGSIPKTTPGGQPLGPGGAVDVPTPGPDGHGGTATSGKPPVLKKLPTAPNSTNTSKTLAMVALAMGVAYLLLA